MTQQDGIIAATVSEQLAVNARMNGNACWITCADSHNSLTWQQLYDKAGRIAHLLSSLGVAKGDSVIVAAPNSIGATVSLLGIMLAGARALPINLVAGAKVMGYVIAHSGAKYALVDETQKQALTNAMAQSEQSVHLVDIDPDEGPDCSGITASNLPEIAAHDPALLMYTSGTTGNPKGVLLSHSNLLHAGGYVAQAHQLSPADKGLCVLPIYHINGLCVTIMGSIVSASQLVMAPRFSRSQFWDQIIDHHCSWFSAVPTLFSYILNDERTPDLTASPLRFARSASAPLPPEVHRQFEKRFHIPIIETMGLTETGAQILSNPLPPASRKIGSPGIAFGNEVRIAHPQTLIDCAPNEEGEILVRGHNVMMGYYNQPEETAKTIVDGWLRSGDLGRMDEQGFVFVTGRMKELIIKGGENIAPREVDEALLEHPGVLEAAAFAKADDAYGQVVEACVVLKQGANVNAAELLSHCASRIGAFKSPQKVYFISELPKGPSGKVQRLKLADLV